MAGGSQRDDDELITQINVTPLVDVILVLLIILMVTASYIVSRSVPMELPTATGEPTEVVPSITISVDEAGQLYVDAEPIAEAQFRGAVQGYVRGLSDRSTARAVIAADGRIRHSLFIHVIDVLRGEGVTRYAINVRPEDLEQ